MVARSAAVWLAFDTLTGPLSLTTLITLQWKATQKTVTTSPPAVPHCLPSTLCHTHPFFFWHHLLHALFLAFEHLLPPPPYFFGSVSHSHATSLIRHKTFQGEPRLFGSFQSSYTAVFQVVSLADRGVRISSPDQIQDPFSTHLFPSPPSPPFRSPSPFKQRQPSLVRTPP